MDSNWGNGPWLVNEEGNTGLRSSADNKNAFFALTMLTANSEFFGVDVPNVAISNPHEGSNAWTAVQINVVSKGIANPDYISDGQFTYSIDSLNFFATDGVKIQMLLPIIQKHILSLIRMEDGIVLAGIGKLKAVLMLQILTRYGLNLMLLLFLKLEMEKEVSTKIQFVMLYNG
jgi:hypothetical protein